MWFETLWGGALTGRRIVMMASLCIEDEFKAARQRMRHLTPWNVRPVPVMHFAVNNFSKPGAPITPEQRRRNERLALKVLAVHISEAVAKSALR